MHSWRKKSADLIGLGVEAPKADLHKFEGVHRTHGVFTDLRREDDNRLVRKVAVARGLGECLLPIRELHLKCPAGWLGHIRKGARRRERLSVNASPSDDEQIGNAITVYGDLQRERKTGLWRTPVQRSRLFRVGTDEGTSEPIFRRERVGTHGRKILLGLVEAVFRNRCDSRTHGLVSHFVLLKSYMNLMTQASAQMMLVGEHG